MSEYFSTFTKIFSKITTYNSNLLYSLGVLLNTLTFDYFTNLNFITFKSITTATAIDTNLPVKVKITELTTKIKDYYGSVDRAIEHCPPEIVSEFVVNPSQLERKLQGIKPLPRTEAITRTHAHNDYEHKYPLFEALSYGFVSVEADIWLYSDDDENLRVTHFSFKDPKTLPTLEELYLDPLRRLKEKYDNGGIYADGTPLILLIDIKSKGLATYKKLHEVLARYEAESPGLFTIYTQDESGNYPIAPGAVTPIISGNRPRKYMENQKVRYAGYDGRRGDIGKNVASGFIPLISDNWQNFFDDLDWDGTGAIPEAVNEKLNDLVSQVRRENKLVRFWNLPQDAPNVWNTLYEAGVDLINTDDPEGLYSFIRLEACTNENIR